MAPYLWFMLSADFYSWLTDLLNSLRFSLNKLMQSRKNMNRGVGADPESAWKLPLRSSQLEWLFPENAAPVSVNSSLVAAASRLNIGSERDREYLGGGLLKLPLLWACRQGAAELNTACWGFLKRLQSCSPRLDTCSRPRRCWEGGVLQTFSTIILCLSRPKYAETEAVAETGSLDSPPETWKRAGLLELKL